MSFITYIYMYVYSHTHNLCICMFRANRDVRFRPLCTHNLAGVTSAWDEGKRTTTAKK